ncbi:MAG: hypothetical protein IJU94_01065 [Clostridia bacterium]|nr:hypothetical protein [Clostridia bacterium]
MPKEKNIHSGHRIRVKNRFCKDGLDSFADHNVLELMLFYSVPRKDTNELAHRLIESFGSFHAVLEASKERLMEVPGVTENTAVLIRLFNEVGRRYNISRVRKGIKLNDMASLLKYAAELCAGKSNEVLYIICLDCCGRLLGTDLHTQGTEDATEVCMRRVIDSAVKNKAKMVVLVHNHPISDTTPSPGDIQTTLRIKALLSELNINLADHIIVDSTGQCESMVRLGIM